MVVCALIRLMCCQTRCDSERQSLSSPMWRSVASEGVAAAGSGPDGPRWCRSSSQISVLQCTAMHWRRSDSVWPLAQRCRRWNGRDVTQLSLSLSSDTAPLLLQRAVSPSVHCTPLDGLPLSHASLPTLR